MKKKPKERRHKLFLVRLADGQPDGQENGNYNVALQEVWKLNAV